MTSILAATLALLGGRGQTQRPTLVAPLSLVAGSSFEVRIVGFTFTKDDLAVLPLRTYFGLGPAKNDGSVSGDGVVRFSLDASGAYAIFSKSGAVVPTVVFIKALPPTHAPYNLTADPTQGVETAGHEPALTTVGFGFFPNIEDYDPAKYSYTARISADDIPYSSSSVPNELDGWYLDGSQKATIPVVNYAPSNAAPPYSFRLHASSDSGNQPLLYIYILAKDKSTGATTKVGKTPGKRLTPEQNSVPSGAVAQIVEHP